MNYPPHTGYIIGALAGLLCLSPPVWANSAADLDLETPRFSLSPLAEPSTLNLNLTRQEGLYTLGPGDRIRLVVLDEPDLSGNQQVLVDGTVNVPLLGAVRVEDLTLEQAANKVEQQLATYLKYPVVSLTLTRGRSLRVSVIGEVKRPGSYTVSPTRGNEGERNITDVNATTLREDVPRVTQLIQLAGGITQVADVRNVTVSRTLASGRSQEFTVDLWDLLNNGNPDSDIVIADGDTIQIPTAPSIDLAESNQLSAANFSPDEIRVNVVGEVKRPGQIRLEPNSPLNTAILAAGGFTPEAVPDSVQLLRVNPNGSVTPRSVPVDFAQGLDDQLNPPLQDSDILIVQTSGIASSGDNLAVGLRPLNLLLNPIRELGNILRIFGADF